MVLVSRAASSLRRVRRLVSNCSLFTLTTMPPMMLGIDRRFEHDLPAGDGLHFVLAACRVSASLIGTAVTAQTSTMLFSK